MSEETTTPREELLKQFGPAKCRGCGMVGSGLNYCLGGLAFDPRDGEQWKSNFYGGYVCGEGCDYRASLALEQTMPGHYGQKTGLSMQALSHH